MVFCVRDCKLHLVAEKEVKGAAYNINPFQASTSSVALPWHNKQGSMLVQLAIQVATGLRLSMQRRAN